MGRLWVRIAACASLLPAVAAAELRVCLPADGAPLSLQRTGEGFDVDVVRALAARLSRKPTLVWVSAPELIQEIEISDLPLGNLVGGDCDLVASVPGNVALEPFGRDVVLTRAYYGAGFELVGPETLPDSLSGLRGLRIAVPSLSPAHAVLAELEIAWLAYDEPRALVDSIRQGRVDGALMWGPTLPVVDRTPHRRFQTPAALRWNFHLATRSDASALAQGVDAALGELLDAGEVARLLAHHGIPVHAPFAEAYSDAGLRRLLESPR